MGWAQISSIDRLTGSFISMTATIKCFVQGMQKSIFALLLNILIYPVELLLGERDACNGKKSDRTALIKLN